MAEMTGAASELPTDAAIRDNLALRLDRQRDGVGIVVGVIDRDGRRIVAHGRYMRGSRRQVDGDTLFEIGSNTKVFTSLLLSDMARRGEVRLDDPVAKYLPEGVTAPERGGRSITLVDLATHTSGLPRLPTNYAPKDHGNPYVDYAVEQLYAFLSGHTLTRDIGARYEYSNVGVGLLGHALARRCGTTYERLVRDRITGPLGMGDTAITLSPDLKKRLAHGHDEDGRPVPNWDLKEATAGAGALRSTANDLLTFLAAALGYQASPLKPAMDAQLAFPMRVAEEAERLPLQRPEDRTSIGLGWHAIETERGTVVMHGGGTGGYLTFMGLNLERGWGAVVLTNMFRTPAALIGVPILTGAPLPPAPKWRRAVTVAPSVLDRYVGRYRFASGVGPGWIDIARWKGGLVANVEGLGEAPIVASSAASFFWRVAEAELRFETDADGRAVAVVTRTAGRGENRAVRE
jgi:D-alanyl-D-alanine-carboxypeptidase/D-alanyl-D-alanine-endopeptidase